MEFWLELRGLTGWDFVEKDGESGLAARDDEGLATPTCVGEGVVFSETAGHTVTAGAYGVEEPGGMESARKL